NTYSLVPYLGRRGDDRKPLYVECSSTGVQFHPDGTALTGMALTPERIRDEAEKRIARQRDAPAAKGAEAPQPYVLMLVRPDGVLHYYEVQSALAGQKFDFGYEFVEADWMLDFAGAEDNGVVQPW